MKSVKYSFIAGLLPGEGWADNQLHLPFGVKMSKIHTTLIFCCMELNYGFNKLGVSSDNNNLIINRERDNSSVINSTVNSMLSIPIACALPLANVNFCLRN